MPRRLVLRLFVVVLVALPVQYALAGLLGLTHGEPWPAVILPGFQSIRGADGPIEVERAGFEVHFRDGEAASVPVDSLLDGIPRSHHPGLLAAQCRPAAMSGTERTERCRDPEVRRWLRDRVQRLFPERTPERVDVVWSLVRHRREEGRVHAAHLGTVALSMEVEGP